MFCFLVFFFFFCLFVFFFFFFSRYVFLNKEWKSVPFLIDTFIAWDEIKCQPHYPQSVRQNAWAKLKNVALAWTLGCGFACIWLINSQVWFCIVFVSRVLIEYVKRLMQFVDWFIFNQNCRYGVSVRPLLLLDGFLEVEVLKSLIPSEVHSLEGKFLCLCLFKVGAYFTIPSTSMN